MITNLSSPAFNDLGDVGRYRINKKLSLTVPEEVKVLTKEDIIAIIKYLIELINSKSDVDDIDHLYRTVVCAQSASSSNPSLEWVLHVWRVQSVSV